MIEIVKDKDLIWDTDNFDVILVGTNIFCALSDGLQKKIRKKYPYVQEANNKTKYADQRKLGTRLTIDGSPTISLCYICKYKMKSEYLSYEALENCLKTADIEFAGKNVATTYMGSTYFDGYGDKDKIINIFNDSCKRMNLTIYDYEQLSRSEENKRQWLYIQSFKKKDPEKYNEMVKWRKENWSKLYL